jgi:DNA-binding transcriptional MerR regulator
MKQRAYLITEVARLAGLSARTLRYYDELGLLVPSSRSPSGYRLYTATDLLRLQQILIGRSLGLGLEGIRKLLDDPRLDRRRLLNEQRQVLLEKARATAEMIRSIDAALALLDADSHVEVTVDVTNLFNGFDPADHEQEARERWGGTAAYQQSEQRTRSYGPADWHTIRSEWDAIMEDAAAALRDQVKADQPRAMDLAERHRLWLDRWFFTCPSAMHAGFGDMFEADARFARAIETHADGLTVFWSAAIRANAARQLAGRPSDARDPAAR